MYNWSVDEQALKKNPAQYTRWRLEQLINFGLNGEKINERELLEHFSELNIDLDRRKLLALLLNE